MRPWLVFMRYDAYVAPQCNEIRATVNFNRRKQGEQERFDDFVTTLKLLVKDCGYENEDRMLRDAIVLRSLHSRVQEKCLEEGNTLTLERALEIGRNHELSLTNMKTITEEDATVKFVRRSDSRKPHKKTYRKHPTSSQEPKTTKESKLCPRCGYNNDHSKFNCPAKNEKCTKCKRKGHFAKVCRRYKTHTVQEDRGETELESGSASESECCQLVKTVNTVKSKTADDWWEIVMLNGHPTKAQIDTGSSQSLMSYDLYKEIKSGPLHKSDKKFQSYTKHNIKVYGYAYLSTAYKQNKTEVKFYIVETKQEPLLSGEASKKLGLIERVHTVKELEQFPELTKTTGTLPGTYQIKIDPTI